MHKISIESKFCYSLKRGEEKGGGHEGTLAARFGQGCSLKRIRELSFSYNKNMEKCKVWVWCVLFALKQCNLSFFFFCFPDFLFQKLYSLRGKKKVFSVNIFAIH